VKNSGVSAEMLMAKAFFVTALTLHTNFLWSLHSIQPYYKYVNYRT